MPDFIHGITREIWEERGVGGKLDRYYAPTCLMRAANRLAADNRDVLSQTLATLHQFPDRQLVGKDVIWTVFQRAELRGADRHRIEDVCERPTEGLVCPDSMREIVELTTLARFARARWEGSWSMRR